VAHYPAVVERRCSKSGICRSPGHRGPSRQAIPAVAYAGVPEARGCFLGIESAAILFTDVVGSTELSQRLSPETAEEVRRGHFSILRQAIAEAGGNEIKNLGDGLMVVFNSASAALACAVAMQQSVERDNRDREHSVGLRVGLSGGEVTREDNDCFGDPVVEAARLCAMCDGGQVFATEWVRLTAGRRGRHDFRSLGELTLKGLTDPIQTFEVAWEPLRGTDNGTSIPLSGRLAVRPVVGVVGREAEMQMMTDAARRVAGGEGREVLLVSGEAGLGKTTLVAEAARAAFDTGACVLFGHCEEDLATPYQLFAEALGHYVTHAPEAQLLAHVEAHGSELSRLVPALASRIRELPPSKATDSDTERFLLFAAVVGLVGTMSKEQAVVLVLDDLQWADKGSLLLLRHLAAAEQSMRVLILGTYRDSELSQTHPLTDTLAALHRHRGVSRMELAGLNDSGVVALLEATAGQSLDAVGQSLAKAVSRETDGNPFFVSEVLRHLSETGAIYQDTTGRWVADVALDQLALPDSVRVVIGARVGRLGNDGGRVLSVASVMGRDFDLDLLARATKTSEDDLLDILDAAASVALVREVADTGRYCFAHALIQHTLYEDLGHNRRARIHRQVAEALEDLCGDRPGARVGELARHWTWATQPIDLAKAIGYSKQAGDAALGALAPGDALRYYAQALDLYLKVADPDPVLGIDLAIGLGTAQRQIGDPASRVTLLSAARQAADLGDTDRLVAAALANNRGYTGNNNATDTDKVNVLEMALDRLSAGEPDRALVLATLCSEIVIGSPLERLQALADEALAIAESSGDDATIVRVLNQVILPSLVPSLLDQTLARTADALVRAKRLGDPVLLFFAAHARASAVFLAGDIDEMDRCIETMGFLADQIDQPILSWTNTYHLSKRAQIAGDTNLAEKLATEALQIGTDCGQPDAALFWGGQILVVSTQRGAMGELIPFIEQMLDETSAATGALTSALAVAHAEADHTEDTRRFLEEFAAADFDLPTGPGWITTMYCYAEAAIQCGDPKYAGPLFDRLAPWAEQSVASGSVMASGLVSHSLGGLATVLGRYDEADSYFNQSSTTGARMKAKFYVAITDLLWGTMLAKRRASGDVERARDLLTKAHTAAVAHGYGTVERRATAALQSIDA
jgi:class 3 adenylate cyclase